MPKRNFEKSMQELTDIVSKLEEGNVELDEALTLFEKGIGLSKELTLALETAEQKVTKLTASESGEPGEEPFDNAEDK